MYFEIIGSIQNVETIAVGKQIREIQRLRKQFGLVDGVNLKVLHISNL